MMKSQACCYPGTFDPFTLGHLDIAERASQLFGSLTIAISNGNSKKAHWLPIEKRVALAKQAVSHLPNVSVETFSGLLVDFLNKNHLSIVVRALRDASDLFPEVSQSQMNQAMLASMETLFLAASSGKQHIQASLVREVARNGGDLSLFVPKITLNELKMQVTANGT